MMETKKIVLATHNQGKIREFQKAFAEIGWQAVPIADIAEVEDDLRRKCAAEGPLLCEGGGSSRALR